MITEIMNEFSTEYLIEFAKKNMVRQRVNSAKQYQKVKSDPVKLEEHQKRTRENARRQYERIKADPEKYALHLEHCRENMRRLNQQRRAERAEKNT